MKDPKGWSAALDAKAAELTTETGLKDAAVTGKDTAEAALASNAGWVSAPVKILADCVAVTTCASGSGDDAVEEVLADVVEEAAKAANDEITRLNALVGECAKVSAEGADDYWESAAYIEGDSASL